jgi:hypothetical protein
MTRPATVLVGCPVKTNWLAGAGTMLKPALVAPLNPPVVAVSV